MIINALVNIASIVLAIFITRRIKWRIIKDNVIRQYSVAVSLIGIFVSISSKVFGFGWVLKAHPSPPEISFYSGIMAIIFCFIVFVLSLIPLLWKKKTTPTN